jgi:hypothetical protein
LQEEFCSDSQNTPIENFHPQPEASIKFTRKELRLRNMGKLKFPKIVKVESNIPTSV